MRAAAEHGLAVMIEQSGGIRERELEVLTGPRMRMVDGILFSVLALGQEDASLLDIPTPLVLLGERIFNGPADHVTMQNVAASRAATELMIAHGYRRILAFGAHEQEVIGSAGLRLEGYRQALAAAGMPYDEQLIVNVGNWHRSDGAEAMRSALASGLQFDAVVAFNDSIALGAVRVLQENGIRVPEDVAVIGFDDIDETRYSAAVALDGRSRPGGDRADRGAGADGADRGPEREPAAPGDRGAVPHRGAGIDRRRRSSRDLIGRGRVTVVTCALTSREPRSYNLLQR